MIRTQENSLGQVVFMTELYDYLGLEKSHYSRFVKKELTDSFYFENGKDYSPCMANENQRGRFRQEYYIHIDAAKKLCMVSKSKKGNEIREELVQLTKNVENAALVSREQIQEIMKMIKIFSVYEHRKLATKKNCENFINKATMINPLAKDSKYIYGQFHSWRNEALGLGKEVLEQRVKEYCLLEQKRIPKNYTKDQALAMMGDYAMIKNAIWDLLSSKNKSEEMINNICLIAGDMAAEMKPYLQRLNQSDLFFDKLDKNELKSIGI